jgi:putative addiction module killer protein
VQRALRPKVAISDLENGTVCVTIKHDRSARVSGRGRSPYAAWFERLNREAAVKVAAALARVQQGNLSSVKGVGAGVYEYRVDFRLGHRIYFGKDGDRMEILVGGGTKKRQQQDIHTALARWQDYKQRKGTGG